MFNMGSDIQNYSLLWLGMWHIFLTFSLPSPSLGRPSSLDPSNRFGDKDVIFNHVSITWGHKDGRKEIFLWDWVSVFWKIWVLYPSEHIPLTVSCQGSSPTRELFYSCELQCLLVLWNDNPWGNLPVFAEGPRISYSQSVFLSFSKKYITPLILKTAEYYQKLQDLTNSSCYCLWE